MRALLDTCVLSELRKLKPNTKVHRAVAAMQSEEAYISVITLGEIAKGIALLPEGRNKRDLHDWLEAIESQFADRLLPVDRHTTRIWGALTAAAQRAGKVVPARDGLIAATALQHGLHLMTRNTPDFAPTGVPVYSPWID